MNKVLVLGDQRELISDLEKLGKYEITCKQEIKEDEHKKYDTVIANAKELQTIGVKKQIVDVDYLTGVFNRQGLYSNYASISNDELVHFMYIDIDDFKSINDLYGHSVGDKVIKTICRAIQDNTREDVVYRIGGDEFVVLIADKSLSKDDVEKMASNLVETVKGLELEEDPTHEITISVGVITEQNPEDDLNDILYRGDAAMYYAKKNGKNKYVLYESIENEFMEKKFILLEKENALKNDEFVVYMQPKMNMINQTIHSVEALVRWKHSKKGLIPPGKFIPVFEECGFVTDLDYYVFEQVCKIKQSWKEQKLDSILVSVNMSRLHLYDREFIGKLLSITKKYNVDPAQLELEFTETVFLKDNDLIKKVVTELKKVGFSISMDDFGSGYSTLNILKDTPIDILKIDRTFLSRVAEDSKSRRIIRSIVSMAKDLHLDIVAEGVETIEQINFLTSCGCEIAQGFYYSKPIPLDEYEKYADEHLLDVENVTYYSFDATLADQNNENAGEYFLKTSIEGRENYGPGLRPNTKALYFPGGEMLEQFLILPNNVILANSFTVSFWMNIEDVAEWTSVFFAEYESGFLSFVPHGWGKVSILRVRDARLISEDGGWYDAGTKPCPRKEWVHVAFTYSAKTEVMRLFINGEMVGFKDGVPQMGSLRRVIIGGDVYQRSFKGLICDLCITEVAKSDKDIIALYNENLPYLDKEREL